MKIKSKDGKFKEVKGSKKRDITYGKVRYNKSRKCMEYFDDNQNKWIKCTL